VSSPEKMLDLGFGGRLDQPAGLAELAEQLRNATGREPQVFAGGRERIERVGVITGGAAKYLPDVAALGYDAFVTGEAAEPTLHAARELGIHFLAGGHYATETFGIKALAESIAEQFEIDWEFLDFPNPV
jgi:putative NIF3 family GTP cyclohydrolase 1 type 2